MKSCTKCGREQIRDADMYCPNCGSRELQLWKGKDSTGTDYVMARPLPRIGAFLIDFLIVLVVSLVLSVPPLNVIAAVFGLVYFLFRDVKGASIGKRLVGLQVVSKSGRRASALQL